MTDESDFIITYILKPNKKSEQTKRLFGVDIRLGADYDCNRNRL